MTQRGSGSATETGQMSTAELDSGKERHPLHWQLHAGSEAEGGATEPSSDRFWSELFATLDAYVDTMRDARARIADLREALEDRDARVEELENTCEALRRALTMEDFAVPDLANAPRKASGAAPPSNGNGTWQVLQALEGQRRRPPREYD